MELNPLTALSPIDGRYARQTDALRDIFSECAFMNARVRVEVEWLISLSEAGFPELPHLSDHGKAFLRGRQLLARRLRSHQGNRKDDEP